MNAYSDRVRLRIAAEPIALVALAVGVALSIAGCTEARGSECEVNVDCPVGEVCAEAGGYLFGRGGICVARDGSDSSVAADIDRDDIEVGIGDPPRPPDVGTADSVSFDTSDTQRQDTGPVLTYMWKTGKWSDCNKGEQTRDVYCEASNGMRVADSRCAAGLRPDPKDSCAWVDSVGPGCAPADKQGLRSHALDAGDCDNRKKCEGCPTMPREDCRDHCLKKVRELNRDLTCVRTGCSTECWVFEGHDFDKCNLPHPIWYGHKP